MGHKRACNFVRDPASPLHSDKQGPGDVTERLRGRTKT